MAFSSGSGYDLYTTTWSPEGRVYQVEFALKHVDSKGPLSLGLVCKDGIVLASQVELTHDTVKFPSTSLRVIHAVDDNIFLSFCGMRPDGLFFLERAQTEAENWRDRYGSQITAKTLADRLALYVSQFTEYMGYRPLGASITIGSYQKGQTELFIVNAAGCVKGFFACASGVEKQQAKTELETLLPPENITVEEAMYKLIKILKKCYDENSSKRIELEVAVISDESPMVKHIPHTLVKELEERADNELEEEDDEDEDSDEELNEEEN